MKYYTIYEVSNVQFRKVTIFATYDSTLTNIVSVQGIEF